ALTLRTMGASEGWIPLTAAALAVLGLAPPEGLKDKRRAGLLRASGVGQSIPAVRLHLAGPLGAPDAHAGARPVRRTVPRRRAGEIPDGHRWDSAPKIRFAPDSPLEGAGFEPSVPRLLCSGASRNSRLPPRVRRRAEPDGDGCTCTWSVSRAPSAGEQGWGLRAPALLISVRRGG